MDWHPMAGCIFPQPSRGLDDLREPASLSETAVRFMAPYLDDMGDVELGELLDDALSFDMPLVELEAGVHVLELFHGPTLAFKDVGARCMARPARAAAFRAAQRSRSWLQLRVTPAAPSRTRSTTWTAFGSRCCTRAAALSELQELQFATLGGNVRAFCGRRQLR